eukprot:2345753-Rhodomonas_salina.1
MMHRACRICTCVSLPSSIWYGIHGVSEAHKHAVILSTCCDGEKQQLTTGRNWRLWPLEQRKRTAFGVSEVHGLWGSVTSAVQHLPGSIIYARLTQARGYVIDYNGTSHRRNAIRVPDNARGRLTGGSRERQPPRLAARYAMSLPDIA